MDAEPTPRLGRGLWVRYALGLVVGAVVLVVLFGHRGDFTGAGHRLAHLHPLAALGALAAEAASLACYATLQRVVLSAGGARLRWGALYAVTVANDAIALSVPGEPAVSGLYRFRQYRRRGASAAASAWALLTVIVAQAIGLSLVLVVAIVVALVAGGHDVSVGVTAVSLVVVVGAAVVLARRELLTGLLEGVVRLARRVSGHPRGRVGARVDATLASMRQIRMGAGATGAAVGLAAGLWLCDGLCLLAAFGAVGAPVPWRGFLLAYGVSQIVAALPVVPGGFGLVEGSLTVILVAYGAARVPALSAVLVYRLASYWLAIAAGWACVGALARGARPAPAAGEALEAD